MEDISYSVVIRTIGTAGEKYRALLDSVNKLSPGPDEVIVVLPEGYDPPSERLGYETFCFSPKGMVAQRLAGIDRCRTPYALVCDDDVSFGPDFVEKLFGPLWTKAASFSAAPLYSFLPRKRSNAVAGVIMASAVPTVFHRRDRYISVLMSTGYSYNRHLETDHTRYYESQSVPWTCFFADVQAFRELHLDQETWLDAHGYAAMDDQTMFYKAWLMGRKTVVVSDAEYEHLDAHTSTKSNKPSTLYARAFNRVVFWHRFIYSQQQNAALRCAACTAFGYKRLWTYIWNGFLFLRHRMSKEDIRIIQKGYSDAWKYIRSAEYASLPKIA